MCLAISWPLFDFEVVYLTGGKLIPTLPVMGGLWARAAVHVVMPVTIGGLIYLCFRSADLLMFRWVEFLGGSECLRHLRGAVGDALLPKWIIYSLPQGLWAYGVLSFSIIVWQGSASCTRWFWLGTGLVVAIGCEGGQLMDILPGAFDVIDSVIVVAAILGALAAHYLPKSLRLETDF